LAAQAGRKASDIPVSFFGASGEEASLRQCQELGIERVVFAVPSEGKEKMLPLLDQYAAFIPKFA
jgi:hypothetical protein